MKLFLHHISKSKYFWTLSTLLVFETVQKYFSFFDQNLLVGFIIGIGLLISGAILLTEIRSFLGIGIIKPTRVVVLMIQTGMKTVIYIMVLVILPLVIYLYRNPMNANNKQSTVMFMTSIFSIFVGWFSFAYALALFQNSSMNIPKKSLIILFKNFKSFSAYILIAIITYLIPVIAWLASGMPSDPSSWAYPYRVVSSLIFTVLLPFLFMEKFVQLKIPSSNTLP